ncbi:hypothetical protein F2Q69_00009353 [Brassica cretica]|uniref:Uncharacterized protein n=1 Tax=Brassica cretica TaxID=69181 RepID=A0A8S9PAJ7_BRACR|nr:hypothetical protein F2Q69_00009353 [Brassica cretica]
MTSGDDGGREDGGSDETINSSDGYNDRLEVLCGKKLKTVVNNESAGIIRMFNTELNHSHDLLISKLKSMKLTNGFTMGSITVSIDVDLQRTKNFSRSFHPQRKSSQVPSHMSLKEEEADYTCFSTTIVFFTSRRNRRELLSPDLESILPETLNHFKKLPVTPLFRAVSLR